MNHNLDELVLNSRNAQTELIRKSEERDKLLLFAALLLMQRSEYILDKNNEDVTAAQLSGLSPATLDRLKLTKERIASMCEGIESIVSMPDPLGKGTVKTLANGLHIEHITVPMGVVCMIYEARPNVTSDAASLCIKSGNSVILRGGKEALQSNIAIAECFRDAAVKHGISPDIVTVVRDTDRETVDRLITMNGKIDLLIPRGGKGLIDKVISTATVPAIQTGAGNCHVYVSATADLKKALDIIDNAKTSRPSVCNAAETLLVDKDIAKSFLSQAKKRLESKGVELRLCEKCLEIIDGKAANESDYETEFNDYILAVKIVDGIDEAIAHINKYGTKHSEAIVTSSMEQAEIFKREVDAACVYVNASTRFTDGGIFGLGAEIGISTQKTHVRGPFGMEALVTYKYTIDGDGQIRN